MKYGELPPNDTIEEDGAMPHMNNEAYHDEIFWYHFHVVSFKEIKEFHKKYKENEKENKR